jgi:hypothetical protein
LHFKNKPQISFLYYIIYSPNKFSISLLQGVKGNRGELSRGREQFLFYSLAQQIIGPILAIGE